MMVRLDFCAALRRDSRGFADAVAAADFDVFVGACPEWRAADLLWHLTEVFDFWRSIVASRMSDPSGYSDPVRPADADLASAFARQADALIATLTDTDPTALLWTWSGTRDAEWVARRMAHETSIHRWDAEQLTGRPYAVEATLASDGVDEFLTWFASDGAAPGESAAPIGGSVHLHCTDIPGEWLIVDGTEGKLVVTREHAKGDCAIRGPASDLILALWRRVQLSEVEVIGDAELAARFVAHTSCD